MPTCLVARVSYRTVNVKPETYAQLQTYKIGGMSFDEVIRFLMERTDATLLHERVREATPPAYKPIQFTKLKGSAKPAPEQN